MFICPECIHKWNDTEPVQDSNELIAKDANGSLLANGDSVIVMKDLKVRGSSSILKISTKVKNIRLVEGDHNIDYKINGLGPMKLKSELVKKNRCNLPDNATPIRLTPALLPDGKPVLPAWSIFADANCT